MPILLLYSAFIFPVQLSVVYQTHQQIQQPSVNTTMVLIAAQTMTFFKNNDQMGISHATVVQLQTEGIMAIGDLVGFEKDSLQQFVDNLHH